jgi:hypothetical protein
MQSMALPLSLSCPYWRTMMNAGIVQHDDRFFRDAAGQSVKESDAVLARYRMRHCFPSRARPLFQTTRHVDALLVLTVPILWSIGD